MLSQFNPLLVVLSVLVAIFASCVALNLAQSVVLAKGRSQIFWLLGGALAMGFGIWSMHFIGMLALEMPGMVMGYDVPLMALSVLVAVGASALALFIISRQNVSLVSVLSGGIAMAAAIAGMHYIGMYSMRMAAKIEWNLYLVVLSVVIALIASFTALFISLRLRNRTDRLGEFLLASTIMGLAISGMHYTGMMAATFTHTEDMAMGIQSSNLLVTSGLTISVVAATLFILGLALAGSTGQRLWFKRNKKVVENLGKSEERFRLLVAAVKEYAIFMLDPDGTITTWNPGAERINGYTEAEVLGKPVSIFYTQEDIDNATAENELRIASKAGHFEGEGQRVRKDGTLYWASVVISPLFDDEGRLSGFSKVTRDITQFKEAEKRMRQLNEELEARVKTRTHALERRENQLRSITNAVPVLIAQLDQSEHLLFANEAFRKWFSLDEERSLGKTIREILGAHPGSPAEEALKKVLNGEIATYERSAIISGKNTILGVTFVPEFDREEKATGFIVVASDITKHKEIQAELKRAKEAAEVANATKSAFLANMSHEIRTPLGAVIGFSQLLASDEMSSSEKVNSVEIIQRNGRLLSNIINDILDLSKVEAGRLEVEKIDVTFEEVMKEISSVLNLEAAGKGIELKVTSEGLIPHQIKTDPVRLRQILLNIVGNAIKFTAQGSVQVKVKLLPPAEGAPTRLAFVVKDTGTGIDSEQIDRLFKPFTQADVSTTRKFGGTGLGLALSKKLANALGGDIALTETFLGKGSTFMITIDPGISDHVLFDSATTDAPGENVLPFFKVERPHDLSHLKILVVDDSSDNQILLRKILRYAGAVVETANNGREGVEKAMKGDFSLVLMDLQMPEMDGYEATSVLRRQGFQKPIIALTAHAMKEERQRTLRSGFDDHITKPVDQDSLVKTLSQYLA